MGWRKRINFPSEDKQKKKLRRKRIWEFEKIQVAQFRSECKVLLRCKAT